VFPRIIVTRPRQLAGTEWVARAPRLAWIRIHRECAIRCHAPPNHADLRSFLDQLLGKPLWKFPQLHVLLFLLTDKTLHRAPP
jgi:hypothetical protein